MVKPYEVAHYPRVPGRPRSRLTGINPRNFSKTLWWRFSRDRRARYVARCPEGELTDVQAALIENIIFLEWAALRADAEGGLIGFKEGREHRRLFQRLVYEFESSLKVRRAPASLRQAKARPGPEQLTLEQHLQLLQQRQGSVR